MSEDDVAPIWKRSERWEVVDAPLGAYEITDKLRVDGGWVMWTRIFPDGTAVAVAMVFVSDPPSKPRDRMRLRKTTVDTLASLVHAAVNAGAAQAVEIVASVHKVEPVWTRKQIYNSLSGLLRRGLIVHKGYGEYGPAT